MNFPEILEHTRKRLRRKGFDPESEESLIAALACENDRYTVLAAIDMLDIVHGTTACVPALKVAASYRVADIQAGSVYLLSKFAGAKEIEFFRQALADPSYRTKFAAVFAICNHGDQSDVPLVAQRARSLAKRHNVVWGDYRSELARCILFLEQFTDSSQQAADTIQWVRGRLHILEESELNNILRAVPSLNLAPRRRILIVRPDIQDAGRLFYGVVHGFPSFAVSEIVVPHRFAAANARRLVAISECVLTIGDDSHRFLDEQPFHPLPTKHLRIDLPRYVGGSFNTFVELITAMRAEDDEIVEKIRRSMAAMGIDPGVANSTS